MGLRTAAHYKANTQLISIGQIFFGYARLPKAHAFSVNAGWNKYINETTFVGDVETNDDPSDYIYRNNYYYSYGWLPASLVQLLPPESQLRWLEMMTAELSGSSLEFWQDYYKNKRIVTVGSIEGASESTKTGDVANRYARVGMTLFRRTISMPVSADEVKEGYPLAGKSSINHRQRGRKWFRKNRYKILKKRNQFRKTSQHRMELKKRKQAEKANKTLTGRKKVKYH